MLAEIVLRVYDLKSQSKLIVNVGYSVQNIL